MSSNKKNTVSKEYKDSIRVVNMSSLPSPSLLIFKTNTPDKFELLGAIVIVLSPDVGCNINIL